MSDVCLLCRNLKAPEGIFTVPQLVISGYAQVEEMTIHREYLLV